MIPSYVKKVLDRLHNNGYAAFVVGGCVRDWLMGRVPSDWDVCTSAKPNEIKACFEDVPAIETGIAHGTVTVVMEGRHVEITTYRIDGDYTDGRHPQWVEFTDNLKEDLARRDFTINAMAYAPETGICDPFDGGKDLEAGEIHCVGEPQRRFEEDSLRIMRGLRFASVLDFTIEEGTAKAMRQCADLVSRVSKERINVELSKLLLGDAADRVIGEYGDLLAQIIPGFEPAAVGHLPKELPIRLAAVFPLDTAGFLWKLKYSGKIVKETVALGALISVLQESAPSDEIAVKKILARYGEEVVRMYFAAYGDEALLEQILNSGQCWSLSDLAVKGRDLIGAGVEPGPQVGELLTELLYLVIEEKLDNDRETLLKYIAEGR